MRSISSLHRLQVIDELVVKLLDRAKFLMALGLPRAEAAALLGSSDESLRVGFARAAKKTARKK